MARRGVCGNSRGRRDSSKIKTRERDVTLSQEIIKMTCFGFMELGVVEFLSSFVNRLARCLLMFLRQPHRVAIVCILLIKEEKVKCGV